MITFWTSCLFKVHQVYKYIIAENLNFELQKVESEFHNILFILCKSEI